MIRELRGRDDVDLWPRLLDRWQRAGLTIRPGVAPSAFRDFEARCNVRLPEDLRGYYAAVDGMTNGQLDPDTNYFWPFAEVKPVGVGCAGAQYPRCLLFADHCVNAFQFAVSLDGDGQRSGPVFAADGDYCMAVAPSLTEFFAMYLDHRLNPWYGSSGPAGPRAGGDRHLVRE